jgi:hypothetical protein
MRRPIRPHQCTCPDASAPGGVLAPGVVAEDTRLMAKKISPEKLLFFRHSLSHYIKYTKRYMFGAVNVGKKLLITQFCSTSPAESFEPNYLMVGQYLPQTNKTCYRSATRAGTLSFFSQLNKAAGAKRGRRGARTDQGQLEKRMDMEEDGKGPCDFGRARVIINWKR